MGLCSSAHNTNNSNPILSRLYKSILTYDNHNFIQLYSRYCNQQQQQILSNCYYIKSSGSNNEINYLHELDMPINLLTLSAWSGNVQLVYYLLTQHNINPNPSLQSPPNSNKSLKCIELVDVVVSNSVICSALLSVILTNRSMAYRNEIIRLLLRYGANPAAVVKNSSFLGGRNAFQAALDKENYEIAKLILTLQPKLINEYSKENRSSPLIKAIKTQSASTVNFLLQNNVKLEYMNGVDESGTEGRLLHLSLALGSVAVVKSLFTNYTVAHSFQWMPQYLRCLNLVEYLMSSGIEAPPIHTVHLYCNSFQYNQQAAVFSSIRHTINKGSHGLLKRLHSVREVLDKQDLPSDLILSYAYNIPQHDLYKSWICYYCMNSLTNPCKSCDNSISIPEHCAITVNANECNHTFHLHCIRDWINKNKQSSCPFQKCNKTWKFHSVDGNNIIINTQHVSHQPISHTSAQQVIKEEKEEKEGKEEENSPNPGATAQPVELSNSCNNSNSKGSSSGSSSSDDVIRIGTVCIQRLKSLDIPLHSTIDNETADKLIQQLELEESSTNKEKEKENSNKQSSGNSNKPPLFHTEETQKVHPINITNNVTAATETEAEWR
jgi:hypothetical protein